MGGSHGSRWTRSLAEDPPAALEKIKDAAIANHQNQVLGNDTQSLKAAYADGEAPKVYVATTQAELLLTQGDPEFTPLPGTTLAYVSNAADDIFQDNQALGNYYALIGGRWFTTPSLQNGPWTYEPATDEPAGHV